jgi:hypothetical protein
MFEQEAMKPGKMQGSEFKSQKAMNRTFLASWLPA